MRGKAKAREAYANRKAFERGEKRVTGANALWLVWVVEHFNTEGSSAPNGYPAQWEPYRCEPTRREARDTQKHLKGKYPGMRTRIKKYIRLEVAHHFAEHDWQD